jgi:hypothetical protein
MRNIGPEVPILLKMEDSQTPEIAMDFFGIPENFSEFPLGS